MCALLCLQNKIVHLSFCVFCSVLRKLAVTTVSDSSTRDVKEIPRRQGGLKMYKICIIFPFAGFARLFYRYLWTRLPFGFKLSSQGVAILFCSQAMKSSEVGLGRNVHFPHTCIPTRGRLYNQRLCLLSKSCRRQWLYCGNCEQLVLKLYLQTVLIFCR